MNYRSLISMFCNKGANKQIDRTQKRGLQILHNGTCFGKRSLIINGRTRATTKIIVHLHFLFIKSIRRPLPYMHLHALFIVSIGIKAPLSIYLTEDGDSTTPKHLMNYGMFYGIMECLMQPAAAVGNQWFASQMWLFSRRLLTL